ncbi:MAG: hypothetical protein SGPRY_006150 [Prymnesium sp.]
MEAGGSRSGSFGPVRRAVSTELPPTIWLSHQAAEEPVDDFEGYTAGRLSSRRLTVPVVSSPVDRDLKFSPQIGCSRSLPYELRGARHDDVDDLYEFGGSEPPIQRTSERAARVGSEPCRCSASSASSTPTLMRTGGSRGSL